MAKLCDILDDRSKAALTGLDLPPMTRGQLANLRVASQRKARKYHTNVVEFSTMKLRQNFRRSLERDCDIA
jgi:hypothetical protein